MIEISKYILEKEISNIIEQSPEIVISNYTTMNREHKIDGGYIDFLFLNKEPLEYTIVEVKKDVTGAIRGIGQMLKYYNKLKENHPTSDINCIICSLGDIPIDKLPNNITYINLLNNISFNKSFINIIIEKLHRIYEVVNAPFTIKTKLEYKQKYKEPLDEINEIKKLRREMYLKNMNGKRKGEIVPILKDVFQIGSNIALEKLNYFIIKGYFREERKGKYAFIYISETLKELI